ncbi:hypothetical protein UJ101_00455 [Flavobacteriaceae bacterium UJ101]|nr:hypothetical protein UJ101_00455 [Flavobacteriaceae bacterium UJ101]
MKKIIVRFIIALLTISTIYCQGSFDKDRYTESNTQLEGPESVAFQTQCLGRYLIDLPEDMKLMSLSYVHPLYQFSTYGVGAEGGRDNKGLLLGENRIRTWLDFVEAERKNNERYSQTEYIIKHIDNDIKIAVLDVDIRALRNDPNADLVFQTYLLIDNSKIQRSLVVNEISDLRLPRRQTDIIKYVNERANNMVDAARDIKLNEHASMNGLGLCFPDGIYVHALAPEKDMDGSYRELYTVAFRNGKNSSIEFDVTSYPKGSERSLAERIDKALNLWSTMLANKEMSVAGREGRLFISNGPYSPSLREFVWVSTDSKVNSVRNTHIQIMGELEIDDYPQMKPLNATDVIVALLKSIRIRENGMSGVME